MNTCDGKSVAWRAGRLVETDDAGPDAVVHDVGKRRVLPGFIDPHHHAAIAALYGGTRRFVAPDVVDIPSFQRALAEVARKDDKGWIVITEWNEELLVERRAPTRAELDDVVPDRPVMALHYSCHRALVNSRALEAAGIDRNTPDPSGGRIERGKGGLPNGLLLERAMDPVEKLARTSLIAKDAEGFLARLGAHYEALLAKGITRIVDAMVPEDLAALYEEADRRGLVRVPTTIMPASTTGGYFQPPWGALDGAPTGEKRGKNLTVGPVKLVFDGAPVCAMCFGWWAFGGVMIGLMAMSIRRRSLDPFRTSMSAKPTVGRYIESGLLLYDPSEAAKIVAEAKARGFKIASHAIGNAAIDMVLDAYAEAKPDSARIEHATFISDSQIAKIADLGAAVVTQPYFITLPAIAQAPPIPGVHYQPLRSMMKAGVCVAGSSDFPVVDFDPMLGIQSAIDRKTLRGEVREADERLNDEEAVALYTRNAARAADCLDESGTLEIGKRADLVVLDGTQVTATIVGGELRYGSL